MNANDPTLRRIWKQTTIPVVFIRGKSQPLFAKLPFASNNRDWLKDDKRNIPKWDSRFKCWEVPRSWLDDITRRLLDRFRKTYLIQPYRVEQKCAPACWNAAGIDCDCSCMGANHGSGNPLGKWYIVSDTCAVSWGECQYSSKLLKNSGN